MLSSPSPAGIQLIPHGDAGALAASCVSRLVCRCGASLLLAGQLLRPRLDGEGESSLELRSSRNRIPSLSNIEPTCGKDGPFATKGSSRCNGIMASVRCFLRWEKLKAGRRGEKLTFPEATPPRSPRAGPTGMGLAFGSTSEEKTQPQTSRRHLRIEALVTESSSFRFGCAARSAPSLADGEDSGYGSA
jgi:hypothetical protein